MPDASRSERVLLGELFLAIIPAFVLRSPNIVELLAYTLMIENGSS